MRLILNWHFDMRCYYANIGLLIRIQDDGDLLDGKLEFGRMLLR